MPSNRPHFKTDRDRFVAFAFCWADLLFELAPNFDIVFAAGPTEVLIGPAAETLAGRSIYDFVAPADIPLFSQMLKHALRFGRVTNEGVRLKRPDGGLFVMSVTGYCIDGAGSNFFLAMHRQLWQSSEQEDNRTAEGLHRTKTFSRVASQRIKRLRDAGVTPHVAQNTGRRGGSAIDRRTTRHPGYALSQRVRQRVEEIFGWLKTVGGMRKTRFRGKARVSWMFTWALAAYNLVRMRNLLREAEG